MSAHLSLHHCGGTASGTVPDVPVADLRQQNQVLLAALRELLVRTEELGNFSREDAAEAETQERRKAYYFAMFAREKARIILQDAGMTV
jgi:hypothetical protein